jgi:hypothetical protein
MKVLLRSKRYLFLFFYYIFLAVYQMNSSPVRWLVVTLYQ